MHILLNPDLKADPFKIVAFIFDKKGDEVVGAKHGGTFELHYCCILAMFHL